MGKFNVEWLISKRQFRGLTGVDAAVLRGMVERLRSAWERRGRRLQRSGRAFGVGGLEDHLLVLLILLRCHSTQDFLACLYGVDKATICRSLRRIEKIAHRVLGVKRRIAVTAAAAEALIIDCTEQPIRRPCRRQQRWYSGKKKRHTLKNEIILTERGKSVAASPDAPGTTPDITVRRRSPPLPKGSRAYADSGYQGLQHDHADTDIPYKKTKHRPLTTDERAYNHALSRFRVRVEHAFARMKRFRIIADTYRYPRSTHALKCSIIAGITNFIAGF